MTNLSGTNLNNGTAVGPQGEGRDSPSTFPTYPAYKDSGVEWLGEVPEHWNISPLKFSASCNDTVLPDSTDDDYEIEYVEISDVNEISGITGSTSYKFSDAPSRARRMLQDGDVLISTVRTYLRAIAPVVTPPENLIASTGFAVVRPRKGILDGAFLGYLLRAEWWISEVIARSVGVSYPAINASDLIGLNVPVPAWQEQTQIARFLDHETARIDALIEEQQRLIELLKEKRRGIVLSALSDTSLPLVRIGHAVDVISRPVKQREDESYTPIGLFNRDRGLFHKEPREMQDMGDSDFFWIKSGDLIISGQFAWEGAVAMAGESEEGLVVSHRYPVLRGKHGVANTEYLYAILTTKHGDFLLNESSRGAAGRNRPLNLAALLKEKIRIPSKEIQEQVSNLVQNEAKVLTECRQQISLLQERRSALISAAVTGKIDVRGWQPAAHSQAPESAVAEAH